MPSPPLPSVLPCWNRSPEVRSSEGCKYHAQLARGQARSGEAELSRSHTQLEEKPARLQINSLQEKKKKTYPDGVGQLKSRPQFCKRSVRR